MAKILIVDDNKKNLQVLGNILYEKKHKVAMALDGLTAIKLAEKIAPDLILLDIMMPGMDGFEVSKVLKSQKNTKSIPIIFLTAKVDLDDVVKGFNLGAVDYVTKPFKKEELLARVKNQIEIINTKKELEELNKFKDQLLSVFASNVKHAVDKFIEVPQLLMNPKTNLTNTEINDVLIELEQKSHLERFLIDNISWWINIQQNKIPVKLEKVQLSKTLNQVIDEFEWLRKRKGITFESKINEKETIICDAIILQVCLKNIIHNALKYSMQNSTIQLKFDSNIDSATIIVTNYGIGIDNEVIERILSSFESYSKCGTMGEKGNGIGLKVVNELMMQINGKVIVKSEPDAGTQINLVFQK